MPSQRYPCAYPVMSYGRWLGLPFHRVQFENQPCGVIILLLDRPLLPTASHVVQLPLLAAVNCPCGTTLITGTNRGVTASKSRGFWGRSAQAIIPFPEQRTGTDWHL